MEEKPNYYAIIPADVRYDTELKSIEKLLYGEITTLTQKTGECWASNSYFAKLYNLYPTTISKYLNHLKQKGYININIKYFENTKQIERRIISIVQTNNTYCSNEQEGNVQLNNGGIVQTSKENNTSINNININNNNRRFVPPTLEEIKNYCLERNNNVDYQKFYDFYSVGNWKDSKGNKIKSWKQKVITWEKHEPKKEKKTPSWLGKTIELDNTNDEEMDKLLKEIEG